MHSGPSRSTRWTTATISSCAMPWRAESSAISAGVMLARTSGS